ncbi:MAG TPA: type II toxin-antitoxin system Phd/YefM family antitoxin, partial [Nevskiaceae bacterium]|nr:type II toxin-antitoxin system Phd/YefM family antitoxin [Nevskiaceae bacterium]
MESEISKSQFKARALAIFRQVERTGEPVVITDRGTPALVLRKYTPVGQDPRDRLTGSVFRYDDPT